jgi:hypothetical protein
VFSGDFFAIALQVIRSWQVIFISVAVVIYIFLVSFVAKMYNSHRSRTPKPKKEKAEAIVDAAEDGDVSASGDDELGLEEE